MKFLIQLLLTPPLVIILSCSSLTRQDDVIDAREDVRLVTYLKARDLSEKDAAQACRLFSELSLEQEFTLKELALLRARKNCKDTSSLLPIDENLLSQKPWFQSVNVDRALAEALRKKSPLDLALAYRSLGMVQDRSHEKLRSLLKAKAEAAKTKDVELQKDIEQRIYRVAPRLIPQPETKDFQRVAHDFIYNREFQKGRAILQKIINNPKSTIEQQFQARKLVRNSYKTEQNKAMYLSKSKELVNWLEKKGGPARLNEAYILYARGLWTEGFTERAKKVLAIAEKKLKGKHPLDDVEFIRGRMAEEIGDFEGALEHYDIAKKESKDKSLTHFRILFSHAWSLRKLGLYKEAADAFAQLQKETEDPFDRNRYAFWKAKSLKQAKEESEAEDEFERLAKEDLLGYYGLLSHLELDRDLPPLKIEYSSRIPSEISKEENLLIRALTFTQENEVLEKYLQTKTSSLRANSKPDLWIYYLKSYARAGLYLPLFSQLGLLETNFKNQLLQEHPELLFPRKYTDIIQTSAENAGVRPELMLSIIRQESAFNTFARSPADAFGLMQILPGVARSFEKISHHEDLYKPEVNIPIGAKLLGQLQKKYKGQMLLTAAAYNANEKAIESWLTTRLKNDPLEFIEDIPYDETRGYVKLVLRNFIFYARLANPDEPYPFPKWALEDFQASKVSTR